MIVQVTETRRFLTGPLIDLEVEVQYVSDDAFPLPREGSIGHTIEHTQFERLKIRTVPVS